MMLRRTRRGNPGILALHSQAFSDMPRFLRKLLPSVLISLLPASTALAWGPLGHALVGELAQRHLTPKAQQEVAVLLKGESEPTLAGISSWADALRYTDPARFKTTSRWHYINAKGGGCNFDLTRDCPDGACVVGAIDKQLAILGDRSQPLEARRDALKFVVHLVGDEHQPMHAGNRTDSGGNRFQISLTTSIPPESYARDKYVDGVMGTNLHSVWDYYIPASRGLKLQEYADLLDKQPWPAPSTTPVHPLQVALNWAEQSCTLIDEAGLYPADNQHKMDHTYLDKMRPLAEQRISLAGDRLAVLLNQTLGATQPK